MAVVNVMPSRFATEFVPSGCHAWCVHLVPSPTQLKPNMVHINAGSNGATSVAIVATNINQSLTLYGQTKQVTQVCMSRLPAGAVSGLVCVQTGLLCVSDPPCCLLQQLALDADQSSRRPPLLQLRRIICVCMVKSDL